MRRRTYLGASSAFLAGLAGCIGGGSSTGDADGYAPEGAVESTPEEREVDPSSFETLTVGGQDVPLVPVDVAHYWYGRREARFADARGSGQYDESHVAGAALSPARRVENWSGSRNDDPAADWPQEDRIVCYCGCPHHLSSLRAGEFRQNGYEEVYAIDEGYGAWLDNGYPTAGQNASGNAASYEIRGETDPADAGENAWAVDAEHDKQEAGPIGEDGTYALHLKFGDIPTSTPITVSTPSYEVTAPLSAVTGSVVTGEME